MFKVAKYWFELYVRYTPGGEQLIDIEVPMADCLIDPHTQLVALIGEALLDLMPLKC